MAAVSIDEKGHPIAMNLNVVKGFRLNEISKWAKQHLEPDCMVISACFSAAKEAGCYHLGNVKNVITETYHSINSKYASRYLAEFCY